MRRWRTNEERRQRQLGLDSINYLAGSTDCEEGRKTMRAAKNEYIVYTIIIICTVLFSTKKIRSKILIIIMFNVTVITNKCM